MGFLLGVALTALLASSSVYAGSLKDIEHVVIFMQENRAQDTVGLPSLECKSASGADQMNKSTMVPWQVFVASPIPTFRSTLMGNLFGTSKCNRRPIIHI